MAPTDHSHRRTHNLLLISKLLNQRDAASPFTLVLDSLEQPAKPLLREYLRRAKISKCYSIFLSFETLRSALEVDVFIPCHDKTPQNITHDIAQTIGSLKDESTGPRRVLILIDSLTTLSTLSTQTQDAVDLPGYLSSLLAPPKSSPQAQIVLVAVYHQDVPLPSPASPYAPSPLTLLTYLATTIITVHSLPQLLAEKAARERSLPAPVFGLEEEIEGVVIGLKPKAHALTPEQRGIVLELEHRRKSGRGVHEWYFLPTQHPTPTPQMFKETATLLDDHPAYRTRAVEPMISENELLGMTFDLNLTERQKQEREGVVLPYMDAQKGGGEGGRILYDMGVEDDFDDEEDEI